MLSYGALTTAPPVAVWPLIARPERWHEWAPHVRGAWGLGYPEVVPGRAGAVRAFGAVPIPARITAKQPGRSWTWRVGPATLVHRVEERPEGSFVSVLIDAPAALELLLRATYGPLVQLLMVNLARVAAADVAPPPAAR